MPLIQKTFVFNHTGESLEENLLESVSALKELSDAETPSGDPRLEALVKPNVEKALELGQEWLNAHLEQVVKQTFDQLSEETDRLKYLAKVNPKVSEQEVKDSELRNQKIIDCLKLSRPRLDAIRLVLTS